MNWTETRQQLIDGGIAAERLPDEWRPGIGLSRADLRGANLSRADLRGADGPFTLGYFGRHHAIAAGGYIAIGCERHTYSEWLERAEKIGRRHGYTDAEISDYVAWIRLAITRQQRVEAEIEASPAARKTTSPAA